MEWDKMRFTGNGERIFEDAGIPLFRPVRKIPPRSLCSGLWQTPWRNRVLQSRISRGRVFSKVSSAHWIPPFPSFALRDIFPMLLLFCVSTLFLYPGSRYDSLLQRRDRITRPVWSSVRSNVGVQRVIGASTMPSESITTSARGVIL